MLEDQLKVRCHQSISVSFSVHLTQCLYLLSHLYVCRCAAGLGMHALGVAVVCCCCSDALGVTDKLSVAQTSHDNCENVD